MRYHLLTLGCPKNTTDSDRIARELNAQGHRPVHDREHADLILLNTCGFIDDAKTESANAARQLAHDKRDDQRLLLVGCWSQIEQSHAASIVGVDDIFGIEAWQDIANSVGPASISDAASQPEPIERDIPTATPVASATTSRPSAYLKISDGCARPCTFCNIPAIKGRQFRSADPDALLHDAQQLVHAGARELVLVAQDSTSYGIEQGDPDGLPNLLQRLAHHSGADWLRLMYAYPGFVTPA